jgi:hypothetical protein
MQLRRFWSRLACGSAILFFMASAAAWYLSYRRTPELDRSGPSVDCGVSITVGQLGFWMNRHAHRDVPARWACGWGPMAIDFRKLQFSPGSADFSLLDFRVVHEKLSTGGDYYLIELPLWLMTSASGGVAILCVWHRWRGRRRRLEGHCPVCGYDLRASPDRCPECGTPRSGAADSPISPANPSSSAAPARTPP